MTASVTYEHASVPVRPDIADAHRRTWRHIASPGTWFTGAERVAIATAARAAWSCALCQQRKDALSPYEVTGDHDGGGDGGGGELSSVLVDAIHRIVTDPGRLSRRLYDDVLASGVSDAQYVEMLSVVISVVAVDVFCRSLGIPPQPLPAPQSGQPSGERPPSTMRVGAWVPTVDFIKAKNLPKEVRETRRAANIIKALSLVPDEVMNLFPLAVAHYVPGPRTIDVSYRGDRALTRPQMEFIAAKVASVQQCFY